MIKLQPVETKPQTEDFNLNSPSKPQKVPPKMLFNAQIYKVIKNIGTTYNLNNKFAE